MWWPGDQRVEKYMPKVREAIERNIPGGCTDIYNRAYEAVYQAIIDAEKTPINAMNQSAASAEGEK